MPMTITEKILAAHAGKETASPGELIEVDVDLALANDITAPLAIGVFHDLGTREVFRNIHIIYDSNSLFTYLSPHNREAKRLRKAKQTNLLGPLRFRC